MRFKQGVWKFQGGGTREEMEESPEKVPARRDAHRVLPPEGNHAEKPQPASTTVGRMRYYGAMVGLKMASISS